MFDSIKWYLLFSLVRKRIISILKIPDGRRVLCPPLRAIELNLYPYIIKTLIGVVV
jgi:hypothetical protein